MIETNALLHSISWGVPKLSEVNLHPSASLVLVVALLVVLAGAFDDEGSTKTAVPLVMFAKVMATLCVFRWILVKYEYFSIRLCLHKEFEVRLVHFVVLFGTEFRSIH